MTHCHHCLYLFCSVSECVKNIVVCFYLLYFYSFSYVCFFVSCLDCFITPYYTLLKIVKLVRRDSNTIRLKEVSSIFDIIIHFGQLKFYNTRFILQSFCGTSCHEISCLLCLNTRRGWTLGEKKQK